MWVSPKNCCLASQKLQLDKRSSKKHESVVAFLIAHGFSDAQIMILITKQPMILKSRVDKNLQPKIQYLFNNGFASSILPVIVISNPAIFRRSLSSLIKPSFDFLKTVIETSEKVVVAVKCLPWLLTSDLKAKMQQNVYFLISEAVPMENISKLILFQPRVILQNVDKVTRTVKRKIEMFKSLGCSEEEIMSASKRFLSFLTSLEEKIKSAVNFYVNTMKLEPWAIFALPKFLNYAIDKRMQPRYNLMKFLESKGLLEWNKKLVWELMYPE
ncbi:transcription termination factor MTERF5, chloroplastic-like [Malania oleifera]|uniref:transcription termination factor MTERF5, chloroplastic-like n=1 Tax=Malania oleifera TaxID=397392 RepID=UPI0025AE2DAE|nr:transcription termination factor MTERF5, chloroplastic-like [Malania oleifera]